MFVLYVDGIDMSFKEGDMAKKITENQVPHFTVDTQGWVP